MKFSIIIQQTASRVYVHHCVSGCVVKASLMKTPMRRKRKKPTSVLLDRSELLVLL